MLEDRPSVVLRTIKLMGRGAQIGDKKTNPPSYQASFECTDGANDFELKVIVSTDAGPSAAMELARSSIVALLDRLLAEAKEGDLGHGYLRL